MRSKSLIIATLFLVPTLGAGIIGYSIGHTNQRGVPDEGRPFETESPQIIAARDSLSGTVSTSRRNAITRTVALISPAVVGINVTEVRTYRYRNPWGDDPFFHFFGDQLYTQKVQDLGSGFLISPEGYIITNDHVAGNAKEITVTLTNGEKYKAELIGSDQVSDVALLKISGKSFPYLRLGNSDDVIIGEWAIAFGNPFGLFDVNNKPTVTVGVISATGMNLQEQEGRVYKGMIQTDAAINSGNSGGPLVNTLGEVIGVNAVIYTPNQGSIGLGFAIPINRVKGIVGQLKKSGKIERQFWTGLEIQTLDARLARYFGLKRGEGVIVSDVQHGSPAERAGFLTGDIITTVNGEKVTDDASLFALLDDAKVGDVLAVNVIRNRQAVDLSLTLEKRSD
ncbi:MAG: trypsin-like peptidase domain-containing protein [Bacteroidota bacterium]